MINPRWSLGIVGELTLVVDWLVLWYVPEGTPTRGDWGFVGVATPLWSQRCCLAAKGLLIGSQRLVLCVKILIYRASYLWIDPSFFPVILDVVKASFLRFRF